ncbi:hypothetical protein EDB86DRAFT_2933344 [Lactarius hatsudake]|nr:hypothetical protein EDB86DRAFT_2935910 [Lactarius hatsudake]KAH8991852.1 hypothetical protein EDB86DRAFT_2933344 [Lactarius hatsudake]
MSDPVADLLLELYKTYKSTVLSDLFVGIVFGAYAGLYGTSLYILLRNGRSRLLRSTPRLAMLTATSTMFALGLITLVLQTSLRYQQFAHLFDSSNASLWSAHRTGVVSAVVATITRIIYVLSEVVCAWRAAVMWNYDRRVVAALMVFLVGATSAAGVNLGRTLHPLFISSQQSPPLESGRKLGECALILVGPLLATNILSTALIGIKAWQHRDAVLKHLGMSSVAMRAEKTFVIFIESGLAYFGIWVLYLVSTFRVLPDPGFDVMDAILVYFAGLYSTGVIIFVTLRKSLTSLIAGNGARTHFSHPPQFTTVERRTMSTMFTQDDRYADSDITALPSPTFNNKGMRY